MSGYTGKRSARTRPMFGSSERGLTLDDVLEPCPVCGEKSVVENLTSERGGQRYEVKVFRCPNGCKPAAIHNLKHNSVSAETFQNVKAAIERLDQFKQQELEPVAAEAPETPLPQRQPKTLAERLWPERIAEAVIDQPEDMGRATQKLWLEHTAMMLSRSEEALKEARGSAAQWREAAIQAMIRLGDELRAGQ